MKLTRWVLLGTISLSALSLSACRKSDDTEKKAETKVASTTEETKAARPKPPPADEGIDVPTEEDFVEAASKEISDDSDLQKALDQLEKEIDK